MFRNLLNRKRKTTDAREISQWLDAETVALVARTAEALDNARKAV